MSTDQTRRYKTTGCECGSEEFDLEYGEPIRCSQCGNIPPEVPADELEEPYQYTLRVELAEKTVAHSIGPVTEF